MKLIKVDDDIHQRIKEEAVKAQETITDYIRELVLSEAQTLTERTEERSNFPNVVTSSKFPKKFLKKSEKS